MLAEPSDGSEEADLDLGPLPRGHHGLSREQVAESQRERLLAATAQDVAERGYRAATITEIVKLASVSTRDFYLYFESKEESFMAAFDAILEHLRDLIAAAAAEHPGDWPAQAIAALRTGLDFFSREPGLARACLIEPVSATPAVAIHYRENVLSAIPLLARGRDEAPGGSALPASTEDSLIGGVVSLAARSVLIGEPEALPGLLPDLIEFVLSPYVGSERAQRLASENQRRPR